MASITSPACKELLQTLSADAPSDCRLEHIKFEQLGMPEYEGKYAVLIHNFLSPQECKELLDTAKESQGHRWEGAMVNVGGGRQKLMTDVRLCGRIIWDTREVTDKLLARLKPFLSDEVVLLKDSPDITGAGPAYRGDVFQLTRLNERLRFLKYTKGMYFREHMDGSYVTPDESEISFMTLHIYLNNQSAEEDDVSRSVQEREEPLKGGATRFFGFANQTYDVNPATGACLVFQHRGLYHSGEEVEQGTKYTVRTDIMYRKLAQK